MAKKPEEKYKPRHAKKKAKLETILSNKKQDIIGILNQLRMNKFKIKIQPLTEHKETNLGDIIGIFKDGVALRSEQDIFEGKWFNYTIHRNGEMLIYTLGELKCEYK